MKKTNVISKQQTVSLIVPTYKEAENLPFLFQEVNQVANQFLAFECIIVDDNSQDGTDALIIAAKKKYPWLKLIERKNERGLSSAAIAGFNQAENELLVCMDADMSHPASAIPALIQAFDSPAVKFVLASRFIAGASIYEEWGLFRRLNSWLATQLAKIFANVSDPMSGFFALRKKDYLNTDPLNPIGYKIGLELIVKGHFKNIKEVPIHFSERYKGKSKLGFQEQWRYLRHLLRLLMYKCRKWV